MKAAPLIAILAFASAACGQRYTLSPDSNLMQELCLPPCLCPYVGSTGPVSGDFELQELDSTPVETRYTVGGINWVAKLDNVPVVVYGGGTYTTRLVGPAVLHRMQLNLTIGPAAIMTELDSGMVAMHPQHPFPEIGIALSTVDPLCRRESFRLVAAPASCYANCDGSTAVPMLNIADFACFVQRFAAGHEYANCDASTQQPVLNVADFTCFMQHFAAGCE